MDTKSDSDFINKLIGACMNALEQKKQGFINKTLKLFGQLRPVISFDPITNLPSLQVDVQSAQQVKLSLAALMNLLAQQNYDFQIAIDEFQQISKYEKATVIDASLRTHFQLAKNVHYLFLGSERHLLLDLFSQPDKPLFGSIEMMQLDYIPRSAYYDFIKKQFKKAKKSITDAAVNEILIWTNVHTFYTQYFCNKLLAKKIKIIELETIAKVKEEILYQYQVIYINFKKLLSKNQWKVLVAVAKEGKIEQYTSKAFLTKYQLSQSSTKLAMEALIDKSMVIEHLDLSNTSYQVYDVFLWRWAERFG